MQTLVPCTERAAENSGRAMRLMDSFPRNMASGITMQPAESLLLTFSVIDVRININISLDREILPLFDAKYAREKRTNVNDK